jgi:hypothetical protein
MAARPSHCAHSSAMPLAYWMALVSFPALRYSKEHWIDWDFLERILDQQIAGKMPASMQT